MLTFSTSVRADSESDHPHHLAVAVGGASHDSKNSAFVGVDYVYKFGVNWAGAIFYEEVSGDFDLRAWGLTLGYVFDSG